MDSCSWHNFELGSNQITEALSVSHQRLFPIVHTIFVWENFRLKRFRDAWTLSFDNIEGICRHFQENSSNVLDHFVIYGRDIGPAPNRKSGSDWKFLEQRIILLDFLEQVKPTGAYYTELLTKLRQKIVKKQHRKRVLAKRQSSYPQAIDSAAKNS